MGSDPTTGRRWARPALAFSESDLLQSLENAFPVRLIATFELKTCDAGMAVGSVLADRELMVFDHLPVRNGRIVGLVDRWTLKGAKREATIGSVMHPLDETNVISADDGILRFIETADESPCRLVLEGLSFRGIVTLSDLQRLPVRPVLFLLVTHLELLMAEVIKSEFREEQWLSWLSDSRRTNVRERAGKLELEMLAATEFCDKRDILIKGGIIPRNAERDFKQVEKLRNGLAHSADIAPTRDHAKELITRMHHCRSWVRILSGRVPRQPSENGAAEGAAAQ